MNPSSENNLYNKEIEPTQFPSHLLTRTERVAMWVIHRVHQRGIARFLGMFWTRIFGEQFVRFASSHRWRQHNKHVLDSITKEDTILLISNHRTFFDLFVVMTVLRRQSKHRLGMPCAFPVRAPFFYDHWLGICLNFLSSGGSMYPPVFRDHRKGDLNPIGLNMMKMLLKQPKVCFGLHPEGRRSQSDHIYTIEDIRPGVGVLIQDAPANLVVLPVFLSGLSNRLGYELSQSFKRASASPLSIYWGAPKRAEEYQGTLEEITQMVHTQLQSVAHVAQTLEVKQTR